MLVGVFKDRRHVLALDKPLHHFMGLHSFHAAAVHDKCGGHTNAHPLGQGPFFVDGFTKEALFENPLGLMEVKARLVGKTQQYSGVCDIFTVHKIGMKEDVVETGALVRGLGPRAELLGQAAVVGVCEISERESEFSGGMLEPLRDGPHLVGVRIQDLFKGRTPCGDPGAKGISPPSDPDGKFLF